MTYKSLQSFSGFVSVGVKYFTRSNGINELTPWSRVLPDKITGPQLVKKFPARYGVQKLGLINYEK